MSTVSPQASRELAGRVRALGATMLDAPVSGSVPAAENGTLAIMVGGPAEAFRAVEPLLRQLGSSVTHVGGNGQGLLLKLAINISLAAQMLAFSEGLLLAERGGIDPELAARRDDRIRDRVADAAGTRPARPRPARAGVVRCAADAQGHPPRAGDRPRVGVPLPAAAAADGVLSQAEELGYGHRDIAALFQVLAAAAVPARTGRRPRSERIKYRAEGSVRRP